MENLDNLRRGLLVYAKSFTGKKLKDICPEGTKFNHRGAQGNGVQAGVFKIPANSRAEPDFKRLGVELKLTAFRRLKNGKMAAKNRMSLNMIDYMNEYGKTFETTSFYQKARTILVMIYLWDDKKDIADMEIYDAFYMNIDDGNLAVIKNDIAIIQELIKSGNMDKYRESINKIVAACPKSEHFRRQPFSNTLVRGRAYSYKGSYVTWYYRTHCEGAGVNKERALHQQCSVVFGDGTPQRARAFWPGRA